MDMNTVCESESTVLDAPKNRNKMEVRKFDFEKDMDDAVGLLNRSFSKKVSKEYFGWKHKENPFGRSFGLVAIEDDRIVGLRMFMKWKFSKGDKTLNAIRPVDTCTDPDYRKRGIFRKLTLQGLEETKGKYDFIFNTPNSSSMGGLLKMGWKKSGKNFHNSLGIIHPFSRRIKFHILDISEFDSVILPPCNKNFSTQLSRSYLKWRYKLSKYKVARFQDETLVVFRLKKIRGIKILVLLEFYGADEKITSYLNWLALTQGTFLIYYLKNERFKNKDFLLSFKRGKKDVTVNDDERVNIKDIHFSAGDLEGVL